jgi:hypothetical protein
VGILFAKEFVEEYSGKTALKQKLKPLFYILLLIALFLIGDFNANEFIYFQF